MKSLISVETFEKNRVQLLATLLIMVVSVVFIAYTLIANWNKLTAQPLEIDCRYFALAFALYPIGMLPTATAWHTLLRALGIQSAFRTNLRLYSLSCLPRNLPGFVWYIASRSLLYQGQDIPTTLTVAATALEILLLAATGFILSFSLLLPDVALSDHLIEVQIAFLISLAFLLILLTSSALPKRLFKKILRRFGVGFVPQLNVQRVVLLLMWMLTAWGGGGVLLFIVARAVTPIEWSLLPTIIGIWGTAGAVGLTIGTGIQGMGIREITLTALLATIMPPLAAIVVALIFRLLLAVAEIFWALLFAWMTMERNRA